MSIYQVKSIEVDVKTNAFKETVPQANFSMETAEISVEQFHFCQTFMLPFELRKFQDGNFATKITVLDSFFH